MILKAAIFLFIFNLYLERGSSWQCTRNENWCFTANCGSNDNNKECCRLLKCDGNLYNNFR